MILIEVRYGAADSTFMTLHSDNDDPLDDGELYWLTISNPEDQPGVDIFSLRKVAVAHA